MRTRQLTVRLETELMREIESAAEEESIDRRAMVRKLLIEALRVSRVNRALARYQRGDISIGRATEDAHLTHWEFLDLARARGVAYPLAPEDILARADAILGPLKQA